jgi:hypothetical protein
MVKRKEMKHEKRRYPREAVSHIKADLSHGHRIFADCKLVDVSLTGLCIRGLSSKFIPEKEMLDHSEFRAIVVTEDTRIKLRMTPKWFINHKNGNESTVGFEIRGEVTSWVSFVRSKTSLYVGKREDIWGKWNKNSLREERLRI